MLGGVGGAISPEVGLGAPVGDVVRERFVIGARGAIERSRGFGGLVVLEVGKPELELHARGLEPRVLVGERLQGLDGLGSLAVGSQHCGHREHRVGLHGFAAA